MIFFKTFCERSNGISNCGRVEYYYKMFIFAKEQCFSLWLSYRIKSLRLSLRLFYSRLHVDATLHGERELSRDFTQEAFVRVFEHWGEFETEENAKAFFVHRSPSYLSGSL